MGLYGIIQQAVFAEIARPEFCAALPSLSHNAWLRILDRSQYTLMNNGRLKYPGDAMMYATIGNLLYAEVSNGTPGLYTIRMVLFPYIMHRLPLLCVVGSEEYAAFECHALKTCRETGYLSCQQSSSSGFDCFHIW
jgi:hypothetical protein